MDCPPTGSCNQSSFSDVTLALWGLVVVKRPSRWRVSSSTSVVNISENRNQNRLCIIQRSCAASSLWVITIPSVAVTFLIWLSLRNCHTYLKWDIYKKSVHGEGETSEFATERNVLHEWEVKVYDKKKLEVNLWKLICHSLTQWWSRAHGSRWLPNKSASSAV